MQSASASQSVLRRLSALLSGVTRPAPRPPHWATSEPALSKRVFLMRHVGMLLFVVVVPWLPHRPPAGVELALLMLLGVLPYSFALYAWTLARGRPHPVMPFADMVIIGGFAWLFPALWTDWLLAGLADLAMLSLLFDRRIVTGAAALAVALLSSVIHLIPPLPGRRPADAAANPSADIVVMAVLAGILIPIFSSLWDQRRQYVRLLKQLSDELVEAQESERKRLARELHDDIGQQLTGIKLMVSRASASGGPETAPALKQAATAIDVLITRVSKIAYLLRPPALDELDLEEALARLVSEMAEGAELEVSFHGTGLERRLPPEIETAIYRVVQEGMTNVLRHASAGRADVAVHRRALWVDVSIRDQGRGFNARRPAEGTGLIGIHERVTTLGGRFSIASRPGKGTRLHVHIPVDGATQDGRGQP